MPTASRRLPAGFPQERNIPQIASKGTAHFLVEKSVVGGRTQTSIGELGQEERVQEIARLLGGKVITPRAVAHAEEMLKTAD